VDFFKEELDKLYEVWNSFPVADAPDEGDLPLADQLVYQMLDLVKLLLSGQGTGLLDTDTTNSTN
jgi:hypothetical protein